MWKAAWSFFDKGEPAAEEWVADQARKILRGKSAQVAAGIRRRATTYGYSPAERAGADDCARYLDNKKDYLGYATALEKGWPIATGVIEGAARWLVKDRMDITGARWGLEGAEAILKLRALIASGDFGAYWPICQFRHMRHYARWQIMSGWQVCGLFGLVWLSVTDERRNIIGRLREALGTGRDPENGGLTDERPEAGRDDRPAQRVP